MSTWAPVTERLSQSKLELKNSTVTQNGDTTTFFDVYYSRSRFSAETTLATMSVLANILAILATIHFNGPYSVNNSLFKNLTVTNILAATVSWICNNTMFLFEDLFLQMILMDTAHCYMFVILLGTVYISLFLGIMSSLTLLGITTIQYYAICKPLRTLRVITRSRVRLCLGLLWLVNLVMTVLPVCIVIGNHPEARCSPSLHKQIEVATLLGANVCVCALALIYVLIVTLCIRIFLEIRRLQQRLEQFRSVEDGELGFRRKAFLTIVMLLGTLTAFFIPYIVLYVASLNFNLKHLTDSVGLMYYMNMLPYLKFLTDPIIYGIRTREVKAGWARMMGRCRLKPERMVTQVTDIRNEHELVPLGNSVS